MTQLAQTRRGSGAPVVLIHGIGHRKEAWGQVFDRLAESYDVVAFDLPGHGESPLPDKPDRCSIASACDQLQRAFDESGLERPHVVGNSLGGAIALELAARGEARSCTAISPAGFYPPHHLLLTGAQLLQMKASTHAPDRLLRRVSFDPKLRSWSLRSLYEHAERVPAEQAYGDALNLRRAKGFWGFFVRAVGYRFTGMPQCPTTIAWGDHDHLLRPSEARTAARRIPDATIQPLPGAGHCPQGDEPDAVVAACQQTFARAGSTDQGSGS